MLIKNIAFQAYEILTKKSGGKKGEMSWVYIDKYKF